MEQVAKSTVSYKDRPFVAPRAAPNARFFSLYRDSAMGNVLGLASGTKLASPQSHVVAFTGDGCVRLFAGGMGQASELGILLFVFDNASYVIVEQGVPTISQTWRARSGIQASPDRITPPSRELVGHLACVWP